MNKLLSVLDLIFVQYMPIVLPMITMAIAQITKGIVIYFKDKENFKISSIFSSGRMPSGHSATMASLVMVAIYSYVYDTSTIMHVALAFVITTIVIHDAKGVRKDAEDQAQIINYLLLNNEKTKQELYDKGLLKKDKQGNIKTLNENVGHTSMEIFAGVMLGIIVPLIYFFIIHIIKTSV